MSVLRDLLISISPQLRALDERDRTPDAEGSKSPPSDPVADGGDADPESTRSFRDRQIELFDLLIPREDLPHVLEKRLGADTVRLHSVFSNSMVQKFKLYTRIPGNVKLKRLFGSGTAD